MQIGVITVSGMQVGVVSWTTGDDFESFSPDLDGYVPEGRAADAPVAGHESPHHGAGHRPHGIENHHGAPVKNRHHYVGHGHDHVRHSQPVPRGSSDTDGAIEEAAKAHHLDPNTMRAVASIESDMNPSSNANNGRKYKGLYQIGPEEWKRFGQGNIYNARDNANAAARMFEANKSKFREHYGRDPSDAELYMMHQQGLGFYTNGAMTNIGGNPYPGMRGPQTHESFESGWGRELERRKNSFERGEAQPRAPTAAPGALQSPSGDPAAFIMHHTGGGRTPQDIENTLHQRGLGVQYIMDRDGNIVEAGGQSHMLPGWGKGEGLSNRNTVGMEVIAKDNNDVTPAQVEAAKAFIAKNYPNTPVYGHGEVNPGHKEADEGMKIVNAIRAERAAPKPEKSAENGKTFDPETMAP